VLLPELTDHTSSEGDTLRAEELIARSDLLASCTAVIRRSRYPDGYYPSEDDLREELLPSVVEYATRVFRKSAAILTGSLQVRADLDEFSEHLIVAVESTVEDVCRPGGVYQQTVTHVLKHLGRWVEPEDEFVTLADGKAKAYRLLPITPSKLLRCNFAERLRLALAGDVPRWQGAALKRVGRTERRSGSLPSTSAAQAERSSRRNLTDELRIGAEAQFPNRAKWLQDRLRERAWNKHDLARRGGADHKTVQKILDGFPVREEVLQKIADGLSDHRGAARVNVLDIPQD